MSTIPRLLAALTALAFAAGTGPSAAAGAVVIAPPARCADANVAVLHHAWPKVRGSSARTMFAVIRVTLNRKGAVVARQLAWNSGDPTFNAAVLRATDRTVFAPPSVACVATGAAFDYLFASSLEGKRVSAAIVRR